MIIIYSLLYIIFSSSRTNSDLELEIVTNVYFIEILKKYFNSNNIIKEIIPQIVLDQYQAKMIN